MIRIQPAKPPMAAVEPVRHGGIRKVAIIGSHASTLVGCPWNDPTWEFWAHSSCAMLVPPGKVSLYIDVHPRHCFQKARKNGFEDYYQWLRHQPTPILMQERYKDIPQAIEYPLAEMKSTWPGLQFGSQVAYLIAYALARGVTHIGLFGVEYAHDSEYKFQRGNAQLWLGIALGRGVQVQVSPKSTLLRELEDYAYETHKTPEKVAEWIKFCGWKVNKFERPDDVPPPGVVKDPQKLVLLDSAEAAAHAADLRSKDREFAHAIKKLREEGRHADAPKPYEFVSVSPQGAAARE
jgi:hypothetical protein